MKELSTEERATRAPDVTDGVPRIVSEWKGSQESLVPVRSGLGWRGWGVISRQLLLEVQAHREPWAALRASKC